MSVNTILHKPPGYAGVSRPTKLTPELQQRICSIIADGNYISTACHACGVDNTTYLNWIASGQAEAERGETGGIFFKFLQAAKEAEAAAEVQLVKDVKLHTNRNVVAPLALLDRRFRERWGQTPAQTQANTYNINIDKAIIDASAKFQELMTRATERHVTPMLVPGETMNEGGEDALQITRGAEESQQRADAEGETG